MSDPVRKRVEEILIKETVIELCKEVTDLKKVVADLKSELHEHKTNSHAKGCWY